MAKEGGGQIHYNFFNFSTIFIPWGGGIENATGAGTAIFFGGEGGGKKI